MACVNVISCVNGHFTMSIAICRTQGTSRLEEKEGMVRESVSRGPAKRMGSGEARQR